MPSDRASALRRREVLALAGAGLSASLAGCTDARRWVRERRLGPPERRIAADWHPEPGQWPMHGYGFARTRHNPHATPPRSEPEAAWTADVATEADGGVDGVIGTIVVAEDTVFVRAGTAIVALDADDGTELWRHPQAGYGSYYGGLLYVAGRLYDVDAEAARALTPTGEEVWTTTLEATSLSLLERDGWVYLFGPQAIHRVHADTGDVVRTVERDGYAPTAMGGPVYAGRFALSAYDVADGAFRTRWSVDPEGPYDPYGAPSGAAGRLYQAENTHDFEQGRLSAYDTTDGARRTVATFPETPRHPAVDGETVYVSTSVVSASGLGTDGRCVAFSLAGEERWRYEPDASLNPPVVANGAVYLTPFANDDVPLLALDAETGEELWRHDLTRASELAVAGETLYVAAGGQVQALRA